MNIKNLNPLLKSIKFKSKKFINLEKFLKFLKTKNKDIKIYILSGGEKKEIELFLKKNSLISYFDEILASEKSKIEHLLKKEVSKNDIFIGMKSFISGVL